MRTTRTIDLHRSDLGPGHPTTLNRPRTVVLSPDRAPSGGTNTMTSMMRIHDERKRRPRRRCGGDEGAVLVEFAIVVPLFLLLLFGVVEFGWAFYQKLDVRSGANEGARLAAVNYKTTASPSASDQATQIVNATCARMGDASSDIKIRITHPSGTAVGSTFTITVNKQLDSLTGFFGGLIDGRDVSETVQGRLEQAASWNQTNTNEACP